MFQLLRRLRSSSQSRFSRKIAFWLFSSIFTIEAILLISSVLRRKQEFLAQISEVSAGKISVLMQLTEAEARGQKILVRAEKLQNKPVDLIGKLKHIVVGGALYRANGELIGTFGEPPQLKFADIDRGILSLKNGDRYSAVWTPKDMNRDFFLVFNHDVASVGSELTAFSFRIFGLVVIISTFATITVWIALDAIAIEPILALRKDLIGAGTAICHDSLSPNFVSANLKRTDELGDVITAFEKMFWQISAAVTKQKQAEAALKVSLDRVKTYSQVLDGELKKGRAMQLNFLPNSAQIKQIEVKHGWEIATFFEPARQVAGDFYDVFEIGDRHLGFVIADVCDKGVGAALFMALFRSLIRIYSQQSDTLDIAIAVGDSCFNPDETIKDNSIKVCHQNALQAISLTNDYIAQYHGELGMFATIFFGILEPETGLLTYINGGHEPLFILHPSSGVKTVLNSTSPAVGMIPHQKFTISQTYLNPGEILFAYTDGVTEARASNGDFFTQKKLLSILNRSTPSANILLDTVAEKIQQHVQQAAQFDDITLLALRKLNNLTNSRDL